MRGLYSHSCEYRKIFLRDHLQYICQNLEGIHFGSNTCRACVPTRANTGKKSWRIIYVLVSCQGVMRSTVQTSQSDKMWKDEHREMGLHQHREVGNENEICAGSCEQSALHSEAKSRRSWKGGLFALSLVACTGTCFGCRSVASQEGRMSKIFSGVPNMSLRSKLVLLLN